MHEEDFGISWKHTDFRTGEVEVRRSRRLVVSMICTVGNYEYGFFWYFYNDASIEVEVKLSGVLTTGAVEVESGEQPRWGKMVAPGIYGPNHQHFFNFRLDMSIDGAETVSTRWIRFPSRTRSSTRTTTRGSPGTRWWRPSPTVRATGTGRPAGTGRWPTRRRRTSSAARWPTSWSPKDVVPVMVQEGSYIYDRARFVQHNLWVTKYDPAEEVRRRRLHVPVGRRAGPAGVRRRRRAAGGHRRGALVHRRCASRGAAGGLAGDAVRYTGFHLKPIGFFDGNPALDLPPSPPKACHGAPGLGDRSPYRRRPGCA